MNFSHYNNTIHQTFRLCSSASVWYSWDSLYVDTVCTLDAYYCISWAKRERERKRERREGLSAASTGKIIVQGTIGGTDVRNETTRLDSRVAIGHYVGELICYGESCKWSAKKKHVSTLVRTGSTWKFERCRESRDSCNLITFRSDSVIHTVTYTIDLWEELCKILDSREFFDFGQNSVIFNHRHLRKKLSIFLDSRNLKKSRLSKNCFETCAHT